MKYRFAIIFILNLVSTIGWSTKIIEQKATHFSIANESIDFIIVDTVLDEKKPIFLWCQGSLPIPLFCEINTGEYFFVGGGLSNFNYQDISKQYHVVVISMPHTPVMAKKENLNNRYEFITDQNDPHSYAITYLQGDYLENYVDRANKVLKFLGKQKWVLKNNWVIAGHSQGTKIASKVAKSNKKIKTIGLFSPNPFGRIDELIRQARYDAQQNKISWHQADSLINSYYNFYEQALNAKPELLAKNPSLKSWASFSAPQLDDWLDLKIPIYIAYGTADRSSDLCDIVPLFFMQKQKNNLTLKRYLEVNHNFFPVKNGIINYEDGQWEMVMTDFLNYISNDK